MRTVCWGQVSDHSQQPESWNEVDVDDSADKAEVRRQVLHDGSFADSPELRLLSEGGAWRKWENCQTLPAGNLKVKVISQQPGDGQPTTKVIQDLRDEMRLLRSDFAARYTEAKSIAFSLVSGAAANQLLEDLHLTEADGFEEAPFETPAGVSDIETFDFSQFVDEDAGTPSFVEYHKKQLQACGVRMGRSGYKVLDLHKTPMYHVEIGNKRYSGGVDGGVVPYAVRAASAAKLLRIGFEHKQSTADKATFRMNHPDVLQAEVAAPRQYSFKEGRGQVVCCLLAAHAMCQLPLDLDLTDGQQHHLLRLRGDLLLVYEGCTPTQAYHEMADFLIRQGPMLTSKHTILEPPAELEEELRRPIKKLKGLVQGYSAV
ncbi:TPA: hypothetical protein ACH3X1_006089 [Trebouxia sp. C0004]